MIEESSSNHSFRNGVGIEPQPPKKNHYEDDGAHSI